jgi:predicted nuclease of predicted toxin-antitoxin system
VALFKVDENLPAAAAELLREADHSAATVGDQGLQGADDDILEDACTEERRVLVTLDRGFGDPRRHPTRGSPGVVVLRPHAQDRETVLAVLRDALAALKEHRIEDSLWIVEPHRIRIRRT